jgi:hypothetical protein
VLSWEAQCGEKPTDAQLDRSASLKLPCFILGP